MGRWEHTAIAVLLAAVTVRPATAQTDGGFTGDLGTGSAARESSNFGGVTGSGRADRPGAGVLAGAGVRGTPDCNELGVKVGIRAAEPNGKQSQGRAAPEHGPAMAGTGFDGHRFLGIDDPFAAAGTEAGGPTSERFDLPSRLNDDLCAASGSLSNSPEARLELLAVPKASGTAISPDGAGNELRDDPDGLGGIVLDDSVGNAHSGSRRYP